MSSLTTFSDIDTANSPEEFVQELIDLKVNVHIYDFMLELKSSFYPKVNMILYDDFAQYIGRDDEFCIDARMYYKYSKLLVPEYAFDLNTCDPKSNIKDILKSSNMKNDINYKLIIDEETTFQGRFIKSQRYMMNLESFYRLLMDIPDHYLQARQIFCEYYSFQTKVIKYYNKFQIGLAKSIDEEKQKILAMKDAKIDNLEKKIDHRNEIIDQQTSEIQTLLSHAKNTSSELMEARLDIQDGIIKIEDLMDMIEELNDKVEYCRKFIYDGMEDYTIKPKSFIRKAINRIFKKSY